MEVSGQLHAPAVLPPGNNAGIHWIGGSVGTRADLKALEKKLTLAYAGNWTPDRPARSPGTMIIVSRFRLLQGEEILLEGFLGLEPQQVQCRFLQSSLKSLSGGLRTGRGDRVPPSNYWFTYWHSPYNWGKTRLIKKVSAFYRTLNLDTVFKTA